MRRRLILLSALSLLIYIGLLRLFQRHFMTSRIGEISDYRRRLNDQLLTQVQVTDTANRELTASERRADAMQLADAFRKQPYANPQIRDEAQFDAVTAPLIEQAASATTDQTFTQALDDLLKTLNYPNARLIGRSAYDRLHAQIGSGFYEAEGPYAAALNDERTVARYSRLPKAPSGATTPASTTLSCRRIDGFSAALISGLQFDRDRITADAERAERVFAEAKQYAVTVIDLRGVGGDDPDYWLTVIAPYLSSGEVAVSTAVNFAPGHDAYLDYFALKEHLIHFDMQDERSELSMLLPQDAQTELKGYAFMKTISYTLPLSDKTAHSPRIYLLIDAQTGGAAESFIDFCKVNHLATVAGVPTSGNGWRMPPFLYRLDHSGLLYTMDSGLPLNVSGDNLQSKTGCLPDLPLSGDDLLIELTKQF